MMAIVPCFPSLEKRTLENVQDFSGGLVAKNVPANAGVMSSIPSQEGPTHLGETKPTCHSYWAHVWQPLKSKHPRAFCNKRSPQLCAPQLEKTHVQQQRPTAAKNQLKNQLKKNV